MINLKRINIEADINIEFSQNYTLPSNTKSKSHTFELFDIQFDIATHYFLHLHFQFVFLGKWMDRDDNKHSHNDTLNSFLGSRYNQNVWHISRLFFLDIRKSYQTFEKQRNWKQKILISLFILTLKEKMSDNCWSSIPKPRFSSNVNWQFDFDITKLSFCTLTKWRQDKT